ncbi:MAG: flagellar FlbD family protein [Actinomycetota bacterium]|nr:flagellar FlbD family protein [Actinomycetota bacterium]
MIELTRLNGSKFILNAVFVETIEATPDSVVSLIDGKKVVVKESPEVIVEEIVNYFKKVGGPQVVIAKNEFKEKEI